MLNTIFHCNYMDVYIIRIELIQITHRRSRDSNYSTFKSYVREAGRSGSLPVLIYFISLYFIMKFRYGRRDFKEMM